MSLHLLANPPLSDQAIWAIVGVGGMIGLYLLMRPRGKHKVDPLSSGLKFPLARQRSVEQQMTNLLVELSDMARQITAQLDTRAAKLELLIREADEKLAALGSLIKSDSNHEAHRAAAPEVRKDTLSGSSATSLTTDNPAGKATSTRPASPPPAVDRRYAEVYALADEGRHANEIARLLQRPAGAIELILALRPK